MAKVAILGFGTVGSGVWEILSQNAGVCARRAGVPVEVGYICDIRDFSAHQAAGLFVNNIEPILQDKDVKVVVETIGGTRFAYAFTRRMNMCAPRWRAGAVWLPRTKSWWPKRAPS